jgi:hypothetical protein
MSDGKGDLIIVFGGHMATIYKALERASPATRPRGGKYT